MIHDQFGHAADSRRQLLQQSLRFLQIVRVEPLREPPVHRSEQVARLLHLALVAPEGGRGSALATTADNTNNNAATNGRYHKSLQTEATTCRSPESLDCSGFFF
jgi:hypothetical protein